MIGDTGGVKLTGDITTSSTAGGGVSITGPVTLEGDVIIDADAAATTVTFNSTATVNSDSTARAFEITTDTGKISVDSVLGGLAALKSLEINDGGGNSEIDIAGIGATNAGVAANGATKIGNALTTKLTLDGTVYKTDDTQTYTTAGGDKILVTNASGATITTSADDVKFVGGNIQIVDTTLTVTTGGSGNAGDISVAGSIIGKDNNAQSNVSLTSGDGTIDIHTIETDMEDVTLVGNTTLGGDITLKDDGVLSITGDVLVDKTHLTINTEDGSGGAGSAGGAVTITGKLDSKTSARDVDILTGQGLTTIGGNIGTISALNSLDINATVNAKYTGGVTISGDIGSGATSGSGEGISGNLRLGNTNTTGAITLNGEDIVVGGLIALDGGSYKVAGGSTDLTIVTNSKTVDFGTGVVTVGNNAFSIDTDTADGTGNTDGADITFAGKIIGDTTQVSGSTVLADLSFDAGNAGEVTVLDIGYDGSSDVDEINAVTLKGALIKTNGKINTVGDASNNLGTVTITGPLSLVGNTTIETDTAASKTLDGNITITGTTNATGSETLTINSGSGAVDFGD